MNPREFRIIARRLMACPAAPFYESGVRAVVERICAEDGLASERDRFGNVLARFGDASRGRPVVLAAHLDHPGFEMVRSLGPGRWLARFNGGVPDSYFRRGTAIRLLPGAIPAKLGRRRRQAKEFEIQTNRVFADPQFGVWELEDFVVRRGRLHGRSCDDLIGVAAVLATLIRLKRLRCRCPVIGLFSRAEEVGFQGALTVASSSRLPRNSLVISLETSKELAPVSMGEGVIIRVGDRASIFDPTATRFLTEVAAELRGRDPRFKFQRALMSGGACEGTAFQEFGFQTAAVCVALGNYHNCASTGRIAAEYVSLADACSMVDLLVETARRMGDWRRLTSKLPTRLRGLLRIGRRRLRPPAS